MWQYASCGKIAMLRRESKRCYKLALLTVAIISMTFAVVTLWGPSPLQESTDPSPAASRALCQKKPVNWIWPKECVACASREDRRITILPKSVVDGVQYLLLFVGHGRSGGSIVGSLIDAHPNAIVANQYMLLNEFLRHPTYHDSKEKVFGKIVFDAKRKDAKKKNNDRKGYSLSVGNGTHVDESTHLVVIGDKGAGQLAGNYVVDPEGFAQKFSKLKEIVQVPLKVIQVVRNPFDNIATETIYTKGDAFLRVALVKGDRPPLNTKELGSHLECAIHKYFTQVFGIMKMETALSLDLLRFHLVDLVTKPRQYLKEICSFLHLDCTEEYLKTCEDSIFSKLSQSRGLIEWRPDQVALVQELIDRVPWLRRYSFTQDNVSQHITYSDHS